MSIESLNEPGGRVTSLTPQSINDPSTKADFAPALTDMNPNSAAVTDAPVLVTLTGSNFIGGLTRVIFGEGDLEPRVEDPSKLYIIVDPSVFEAGTVQVSVYNGDYTTDEMTFTFT